MLDLRNDKHKHETILPRRGGIERLHETFLRPEPGNERPPTVTDSPVESCMWYTNDTA